MYTSENNNMKNNSLENNMTRNNTFNTNNSITKKDIPKTNIINNSISKDSIYNTDSKLKKAIIIYFIIAVFCAIFGYIYEQFSHGVKSNYMIYMFLFPLLGGLIPYALIYILKLPYPNKGSLNIYNSGIATLTVGSCLSGIFEIYGTVAELVKVYWIVGISMTILGLIIYLFHIFIKQSV